MVVLVKALKTLAFGISEVWTVKQRGCVHLHAYLEFLHLTGASIPYSKLQ